jgi:hypothetical protein
MSFVRLLPDHKGLNSLRSLPMSMEIAREVQAAEAVEREPLDVRVAGRPPYPHVERVEDIPVADAVCKGTGYA